MLNKKIIAAGLLLALTGGAFAATNTLADYKPGTYVGVMAGYSRLVHKDLDKTLDKLVVEGLRDAGVNAVVKEEKGSFGAGFFIGHSFCPYFSFEVGYNYYQSTKYSVASIVKTLMSIDLQTSSLLGKIVFPLEHVSTYLAGWSIYGKLGPVLAFSKYSSDYIDNTKNIFSSGMKVKPGYALGIAYNFTDNFGADLSWSGVYSKDKFDYQSMVKNKDDKVVPSAMLFALSLSYKF